MLIWSPKGRAAAGVVASVLFIVFFFLPLAVILMSSLSQQWNGILPSGFTLNHFVNALHGAAWDALLASLTIGFCASLFALLCGVWAALALRQYGVKTQKWLSMVFYLPSAIPSVSVGWAFWLLSAGAIANERHPMDCADSALCADFRLYLQ